MSAIGPDYPRWMDTIVLVPNPKREAQLKDAIESTPARIAVWRAGTRPLTSVWLKFRSDHAAARDAVHSELSTEFIERFKHTAKIVRSTATDRHEYILFPPKGKKVDDDTARVLADSCRRDCDVQIVISDGLSATAVEHNIPDLLPMIEDGLQLEGISYGTLVIARLGRVAIADQISHVLGAKVALNLIGERPGLSSAVGLSAYITYNPGPSTISSDRTVVSNIHDGGTPPAEAGAFIVKLIKKILERKVSGVKLQQLG